jgi:hypothetical protein
MLRQFEDFYVLSSHHLIWNLVTALCAVALVKYILGKNCVSYHSYFVFQIFAFGYRFVHIGHGSQ